jgi:hypothetical protein
MTLSPNVRHARSPSPLAPVTRKTLTRPTPIAPCRSSRPARPAAESLCKLSVRLFKAARRAARAADLARSPLLPLALPQRRRKTLVGWREDLRFAGPPLADQSARRPGGGHGEAGVGSYREQVCSRTRYCPARPEPVKSAYGVGSADLRLLTGPGRNERNCLA